MKRGFKRLISSIITLSILLSFATISNAADRSSVEGFVERCYQVVLGRQADQAGKNYWTDNLIAGYSTGIDLTYSFFFSDEYKDKNRSDAEYVSDLYWTFMGREPDQSGTNYWLTCMSNRGFSDKEVFNGFAGSAEFHGICAQYGINPGATTPGNESARRIKGVQAFVERVYTVILGRRADLPGRDYWVEQLMSGNATGISCAYSFVFCNEYKDMNKSNEDYVRDLYSAFFNRGADQAGLNYWVGKLQNATDDLTVFNGFATSFEFEALCREYGIRAGYGISGMECARRRSAIQTITIATSNGNVTVTGYFDYEAELAIFQQLNAYRAANGRRALTRSGDLVNCARVRATEISRLFEHTRPNGQRCFTAFPSIYGYKGENIAAGYANATEVMTGWRNSTTHNTNMLKAEYTTVGIGVFVVTSGDTLGYRLYYVQNFGG